MFDLQKLAMELLNHQHEPFSVNRHFCYLGKHILHCTLSCTVSDSWATDFCLMILQTRYEEKGRNYCLTFKLNFINKKLYQIPTTG